ncbi:hypothetical protein BC826DRAFT_524149 [Russula brevipes]|nr:hypothetical protein BC826DRAFT_524149 [Russula brevipes]
MNLSGTYISSIVPVLSSRTTTMLSFLSLRMSATPSSRPHPRWAPHPRPTSWALTAARACLGSPSPHTSDKLAGIGLFGDPIHFATHNAAQRLRAQSHSVLATRRRSSARPANFLLDLPPARGRMALVIDPPHTGCDGGMATARLSCVAAHRIRELQCNHMQAGER